MALTITNAEFAAWVEDNNWLKIVEHFGPNGRVDIYVTPSGAFVMVKYDLKKELQDVGPFLPQQVVQQVVQQKPQVFKNFPIIGNG
jgi:hypothetical protein